MTRSRDSRYWRTLKILLEHAGDPRGDIWHLLPEPGEWPRNKRPARLAKATTVLRQLPGWSYQPAERPLAGAHQIRVELDEVLAPFRLRSHVEGEDELVRGCCDAPQCRPLRCVQSVTHDACEWLLRRL